MLLTLEGQSVAVRLASLTPEERIEALRDFTPRELDALMRTWAFERRLSQTPPLGDWLIWACKGGRGSGKTRGAAEWFVDRVKQGSQWNHLLSRTHADVRDTMIQGESGIIEVAHARNIDAAYEPSKRRVWFSDYRAQALMFGAHEPDESRGPQCETGWVDEFSIFPRKIDRAGNTALTNFLMGARLGSAPKVCVTFTPKPRPEVKGLLDRARNPLDRRVVLTEMTLYDNIANLPESYIDEVLSTYRGTRLEAQEILGIYTDAVEGALWSVELLDRSRVDDHPPLDHVCVGVDPPGEQEAECGIVVAGVEVSNASRKRAYVLGDHSMRGRPEDWARKVIEVRDFYGATVIVAETNQGHDMVRAVIHANDPDAKVRKVKAHEGKRARAEPIALLYEAGRVFHVGGIERFDLVEAQMTGWVPDDREAPSPDRMDALVWALTHLTPYMNAPAGKATSPHELRIPALGSTRH